MRLGLIRFIYAYFLDDQAVYVGSSDDPTRRGRQHCKGRLSFNKFLRKTGREKFTMKIVEAFRVDSIDELWKLSAARENHWMDVLGTYRTPHGWNFGRAGAIFGSAEQYESWRAANTAARNRLCKDPDVLARRNAAIKTAHSSPEVKERQSASIRAALARPEVKARQIASMRAALARPEIKARHSAATRATMARPEVKALHSAAIRAAFARPEVKARISAASRAALARPEVKERMSAAARAANARPEVKARISAALRAAHARKDQERWSAAVRTAHRRRAYLIRLGMLPFPLDVLERYAPRA
jgi:hypothetical protein